MKKVIEGKLAGKKMRMCWDWKLNAAIDQFTKEHTGFGWDPQVDVQKV